MSSAGSSGTNAREHRLMLAGIRKRGYSVKFTWMVALLRRLGTIGSRIGS